jgi:predicted phosphodiesterase
MKLLLFSDLHADAGAARRLVEGVDVVVGAGDFATIRSPSARRSSDAGPDGLLWDLEAGA